MRHRDQFLFALRSITAQRLRSGLTALGILIGVAAVVLLTALGSGIHAYILGEFTQFGTHLLAVSPGKHSTFGISGATINTVRPLTLSDADALAHLPRVHAVTPILQGNALIESGGRERRTNVFGVGVGMLQVWSARMASGQFLPADDPRAARPFAVLGAKVHRELFGTANPLGQRLAIGGDRYRIVGVLESKGEMLGFDLDDTVFIPAGKAMELFNRESLMEIDVLHAPEASSRSVADGVRNLLAKRHGREDFTIITQEEMLSSLSSILDILTLAVGALGGISLFVGAVGILTILTIAVSERVGEIGLLRALGAERGQILRLFLYEAALLGIGGGAAGACVGIGLVWLLQTALPALPLQFNLPYILAALCLSLAIGLLSGALPAMRAARLAPQEALRSE